MSLKTISSSGEFVKFIGSSPFTVVHFSAHWAEQCQTMNSVLEELAKQQTYKNVLFSKCDAEELSDISLRYNITAVPTIIIFTNGKVAETVNGANAADLTKKLTKVAGQTTESQEQEPLEDRLKKLINKCPVMVFMKGNPSQPRCGFSRTLIGILNEIKVPYETFDILEDEEVRQGLKTFSNWPTYPQIYVKGELIGGLDIIQELKQNGELASTLQG